MYTLSRFKKHPIVTREVLELIEFGARKHRVFELMPERGILTGTLYRSRLYFEELDNFTTLPPEISLILDEVQNFPIKQFIVGHEYPKERPKWQLPEIPWEGIVKVVSIGLIGLILMPFWIMIGLLMAVDPYLIAVLDDGQESWVCLARWDE